MDSDRNNNGSFRGGLGGLGATDPEQVRAGVNPFDSESAASLKVIQARGQAVQFKGDEFDWLWSRSFWRMVGLAIFVVAPHLFVIFAVVTNAHYQFLADQHDASWVAKLPAFRASEKFPKSDVTCNKWCVADRELTAQRLQVAFRGDMPWQQLWKTCGYPGCSLPSAAGLLAMRSYALHPERFEQDLCSTLYGYPKNGLPLYTEPLWRINPDSGVCSVVNMDVVSSRINKHNLPSEILFWAVVTLCMGAIVAADLWIVRRIRRRSARRSVT